MWPIWRSWSNESLYSITGGESTKCPSGIATARAATFSLVVAKLEVIMAPPGFPTRGCCARACLLAALLTALVALGGCGAQSFPPVSYACVEITSDPAGAEIYIREPGDNWDRGWKKLRSWKGVPISGVTPCKACGSYNWSIWVPDLYYQARMDGYADSEPKHLRGFTHADWGHEKTHQQRVHFQLYAGHRTDDPKPKWTGSYTTVALVMRDADTDYVPYMCDVEIVPLSDVPSPRENPSSINDYFYVSKRLFLEPWYYYVGRERERFVRSRTKSSSYDLAYGDPTVTAYVPGRYRVTARAPGYYVVKEELSFGSNEIDIRLLITMVETETDLDLHDARPGQSRGRITRE